MDKALELAYDQHGLFSIEQIKSEGVNPTNVHQLAARGSLEKVARGVYMVPLFPVSQWSTQMEAVLSVKGGGVIADESALELWELCDVNPRKVRLAVPKKYRLRKQDLNQYIIRKINLKDIDINTVHNISVMVPRLAIERSIENHLQSNLVEQAIDNALRERYITKIEASRLRVQLADKYQENRTHA